MHWGFLFSSHPHFEAVARFLPHSSGRRFVQAGPLSGWVRTTLCCRKVVSEVLRIPILCAIVSKQFACLIRLMRSYLVGIIRMYKIRTIVRSPPMFREIESNHSSWLVVFVILSPPPGFHMVANLYTFPAVSAAAGRWKDATYLYHNHTAWFIKPGTVRMIRP